MILLGLLSFEWLAMLTFLYNGRRRAAAIPAGVAGVAARRAVRVPLQQNATIPYAFLQNAEHAYQRLLRELRYSLSGNMASLLPEQRRTGPSEEVDRRWSEETW
ncbi:hypothetical protein H3H37_11985 [Duganella sp. LX20W]|uniref:Uncharacterized protein n=1 Tax=Rugamonas brunnea TaxID=2758569 RepID=A0A7W2ESG5_9BURK|nr:hypothetical protein [Rugamonas brunnea]MBA5637773.1 hypothetical protein [Rugamonas brunnea]